MASEAVRPALATQLHKAKSTNALSLSTSSAEKRPKTLGAHHSYASETSLNTLPDPRSASSSDLSRTASNASRHPDLSAEVAALSDKLINAINHQTNLDDTLAHARQELAASRTRIEELEAEAKGHDEKLADGSLMTRAAVEAAQARMAAELAEERRQKLALQQEKRGIEQELETLTASLFDEANKMVAAANREKDAIQKKNQQLREQIRDTELLLASQQEQLSELKVVMQQMSTDREDQDSIKGSTAPSTPGFSKEDTISRLMGAMNLTPTTPADGELTPAPSTSLTHLLKTVCRNDLPAYEDYRSLIAIAQSQPASRVNSGTYAGLNVVGLASLANSQPNNSSTSVHSGSQSRSTSSPTNPPGAFITSPPPPKEPVYLKDTKFYKRILAEDIEPTLRLDLAPGISWLTRRSLLSAICDGSLIVEPIPEASRKLYGRYTTCSLCGETRKTEENPRTHRMRTSESDAASRYQLCQICLEKVRATCDLVGFVRMIKDGLVRIREGDLESEQDVWEELVRQRERMFWARMAAGVIPAFIERRDEKPSPSPVLENKASEHGTKRSSLLATTSARRRPIFHAAGPVSPSKGGTAPVPDMELTPPNSGHGQTDGGINQSGAQSLKQVAQTNGRPSASELRRIDDRPPGTPPIPERSSERGRFSVSSPQSPSSDKNGVQEVHEAQQQHHHRKSSSGLKVAIPRTVE